MLAGALTTESIRALVVDDDQPLRRMLRIYLRRWGFSSHVDEAEDGEHAIRYAARFQPDLIILDLRMPGLNGFDALPGLRKACKKAKILVLSMLVDEGLPERVRALGADAFLDKSASEEEMRDHVERLLGRAAGSK